MTPEVVETVKYLTSDAFRLDESKRPKTTTFRYKRSENSTSIESDVTWNLKSNMFIVRESKGEIHALLPTLNVNGTLVLFRKIFLRKIPLLSDGLLWFL